MFPMFFKRVLGNSGNVAGALQFTRLNSTIPVRSRAKEFQKVKLIGTIYQEPYTFNDGSKAFAVRTVQTEAFYKVHRVVVRNPKILSILGNNISVGQRVYVSGDLRAVNFTNSENKMRQMFNVRVNEMYVSKKIEQGSEDTALSGANIDQNHVSILSHIASEIIHLENYSVFSLVAHFQTKNPAEGETEKAHFYRVFVHNPALRNMLKNSIERRDRVLIEGFLNSKPENDEHGEKKYSAYVEATHILKVDRFSEAVNENANESVHSANE